MGRIHVLPEHVANKIAAGEVVERPASVVKELLENSLDAGSTRIRIKVEAGGKRLIQITDNGCGMTRDDALLAFERHATSKIQSAEDLLIVATLGFRGEALPSIASVSSLRRETEAIEGNASPRNPRVATMSRSSALCIFEVAWRSKASRASSRVMPQPLSVIWISLLPPASTWMRMRVDPASREFSRSS